MTKSNILEIEFLSDIFQSINSDIDSLLVIVRNVVNRFVYTDNISVFILGKTGDIWALEPDKKQLVCTDKKDNMIEAIIDNNKNISISDISKDSRLQKSKTNNQTGSLLYVPIIGIKKNLFGVIKLTNKRTDGFSIKDKQFIENFFKYAAGPAIENVMKVSAMRRNCDIAGLLFAVYKNISDITDLQRVFEFLLSNLLKFVKGDYAVIQILSSDMRESYYGFHNKIGGEFWEANKELSCPDFILKLKEAVSNMQSDAAEKSFHYISENTVYAGLYSENRNVGYIAIHLGSPVDFFLNEHLSYYIDAVDREIVSILERKRVFEEKILIEKQDFLETIFSKISHDMRNPLSGISGFVQLIEHKSNDASINEYCRIIMDSMGQLENVYSKFIDSIRGKTSQLEKSEFSLMFFLKEIINKLYETYKYANIEISLKKSEDIRITADKEKLSEAFINIFTNAKEAMPNGGSITVKLEQFDSFAKVEIEDTGIGVPAHIQESLFEPFVTYGKGRRPGIGMSVARNIIEKHRGTISVASYLGKGTIFIINLPLARKETL